MAAIVLHVEPHGQLSKNHGGMHARLILAYAMRERRSR